MSVVSTRWWWARRYAGALAVFCGERLTFELPEGQLTRLSPGGQEGRLQLDELEEGVETERAFRSVASLMRALSACVRPA